MKVRLWLLLALFAASTTWLYVHRILAPWEHHRNVEIGTMKAELGDLYTPWFGTRELLLHHRNPYSPDVSHEIQMAFYGRAITHDPGPGDIAVDEQRFAYPPYVAFLLAPTIHLTFAELQAGAPIVLAFLTAVGVILWFKVLRWSASWITVAAVVLFVLSSPPVVQGLRLRQLGLLIGFLVALAALCVSRGYLWIAGAVLAVSTIKPQMVLLPLIWFLCWAASDWRRRWRLLAGFAAVLMALMGAAELVLPGWFFFFIRALQAYRRYTFRPPLIELALGSIPGGIVATALLLALLAFGWRHRKNPGDSQEFVLTLACVLMVTMLTMPLIPLFNQLLLILPAMLAVRDWRSLPFARYAFLAVVGWPAVMSLILLLLLPANSYPSTPIPLLPSTAYLCLPFILPLLFLRRRGFASPNSFSERTAASVTVS